MKPHRRLLLATGDPRLDAAAASGLGVRPGRDARTCPDLADLLAAAGAGLGDVAVVGAHLPLLDRTALLRLVAAGVTVVGVHAADDPDGGARLARLGVRWARPVDLQAPRPGADLPRVVEDAATAAGRGEGLGGSPRRRAAFSSDVDPVTPPAPEAESPIEAEPATEALPRPEDVTQWREATAEELDQLFADVSADALLTGEVVAVWGPTGAPGRTSVAVALAGLAAARGLRVVLLDLDPYGGTVAAHLHLPAESPGVVHALREADLGLLDADGLARHGVRAAGALVLPGVDGGERWPELRPAGIAGLLEVAREAADLVVLDTGFCLEDDEELSYDTAAPRRNAATLTALAEADRLVVVGQAGPVGLRRLVGALADLRRLGLDAPRTVVVNRVRDTVLGPAGPDGLRADLARLAGVRAPVFLPDEPAEADAALLAGRPLGRADPASAYARALDHLL